MITMMMIVMMTMMMMGRRIKLAIMTIWILFTPSPTLNSFNIVMTLNVDDDDGDEQMIMTVVMILGYHSGTTKHFHFFYKGHTSTPWKLYTIEMLHFRLKYSCLTIVRNLSRKNWIFFLRSGAVGGNRIKSGKMRFSPFSPHYFFPEVLQRIVYKMATLQRFKDMPKIYSGVYKWSWNVSDHEI